MHVIALTPVSFKENVNVACRPFLCVTGSAASMEVSSLRITTRYVVISSTSPDKFYLLTAYMARPSSRRAAVYNRGGGVSREYHSINTGWCMNQGPMGEIDG